MQATIHTGPNVTLDIKTNSWKTLAPSNVFPAIQVNKYILLGVDKKNQLDVTFCISYFSSNNC